MVGEAGLTGGERAQGIGRRVVQVEVAQYQRGEGQFFKKVRTSERAERSVTGGKIIGVGDP